MFQIPSSSSAAYLQDIFKKIALTFFVLLLCSFVTGLAEAAPSPKMNKFEEENFRGAVETGNYKKANEYLTKGVKIDAQSDDGWTALMLACREGHSDIVKLLLSQGASVHVRNEDGETALIIACRTGTVSYTHLTLPTKRIV